MRRARAQDRAAVLSFATRTWDGWDYIPHAWPVWLDAADGVLLVGCAGRPPDDSLATDADGQPLEVGRPLAVARVALLSKSEAWVEGIRVDPRVRGMDVATDLQVAELHWASAQRVEAVRYATGERNEASHRLGARHGFGLLAEFRTYRWSAHAAADDGAQDDQNGFTEEARRQASGARSAALQRLAEENLIARDAGEWWPRVSGDATFIAGARLYEHRAWALQALTEARFADHIARGEVVASQAPDGGWAVAILERAALPAEDLSLHLGLLVGDGAAALPLAAAIRQAAGASIRFRLPGADPALLRGRADQLAAAGFRARESTLHILGRPMGSSDDVPPLDASRVVLEDEPRPLVLQSGGISQPRCASVRKGATEPGAAPHGSPGGHRVR